jgi:hypothetical protein
VARRATVIDNEREEAAYLILLSSGGFYGPPGILNMYRGRFLAGSMKRSDYTAVAVGRSDLNHGLRPLREDCQEGLPLICANLYREGARVFSPHVIREIGNIKIGIFALLGRFPLEDDELEIKDPLGEGIKITDELVDVGSDYIVLLAHMDREELVTILPELKEVDMVIRGGVEKRARKGSGCVEDLGDLVEHLQVPVLSCGRRGRAMGKVVIDQVGEEALGIKEHRLVYLDSSVDGKPLEKELLESFNKKQGLRSREIKLKNFMVRDKVTGKIKERYLGYETCRRCHAEIGECFVVAPPFGAFELLHLAGEDNNVNCFSCHTTGYGHFSGYDPVEEKRGGVNLRGVQCEACHGPGTMHSRDGSSVERARKACRRCHTPFRSPDFKYQSYMSRIIGYHCINQDTMK